MKYLLYLIMSLILFALSFYVPEYRKNGSKDNLDQTQVERAESPANQKEKKTYVSLEEVWQRLDHVMDLFEKGKKDEAWDLLYKTEDIIWWRYRGGSDGLDYPENVKREFKMIEAQMTDAEGGYDDDKIFTGIVTETDGLYSGLFKVSDGKKEKEFYYCAGLIIKLEKPLKKKTDMNSVNRQNLFGSMDYVGPLKGRRVTVYYQKSSLGDCYPDLDVICAVKLVVHDA